MFNVDKIEFARLLVAAAEVDILNDCTLSGRLILATEGELSVCYAPFDYVEADARIVIVGITPGRQQAVEALCAFRSCIMNGGTVDEAERIAKSKASFAGRMRVNLASMLDHIGLQTWLGLRSCASLFGEDSHLVHYTSALRYPVFVKGMNYAGHPRIDRSALLTQSVRGILMEESRLLSPALWIPLGGVPTLALQMIAREGAMDPRRVLSGLPHASGANAERIAYFLGRKSKEALSRQTSPDIIDENRRRLIEIVSRL